MPDIQYAIKAVTQRTGLSAHVIRIWEKRHGAVQPERTGTNRRLYSDAQIERLRLLRDITQDGHSIGQVAKLSTDQLHRLANRSSETSIAESTRIPGGATSGVPPLEECLVAVKALDACALEQVLKRAWTDLGAQGLLMRVVAPLAQAIGDLWREGSITAAHEHFASSVIRTFLGHAAKPFAEMTNAPVLLVATPAGQNHELGALLVAAAAASIGWRVTYLGANLPAAEIAGAARRSDAHAVALSLVYPEDDPQLSEDLVRLRELLPPKLPLLVGGRAMPAYREALNQIGAVQMNDLSSLLEGLDSLRKPVKKSIS